MIVEHVCFVARHQALLDKIERLIDEAMAVQIDPQIIYTMQQQYTRAYSLFVRPRIVLTPDEWDMIDPALRQHMIDTTRGYRHE